MSQYEGEGSLALSAIGRDMIEEYGTHPNFALIYKTRKGGDAKLKLNLPCSLSEV